MAERAPENSSAKPLGIAFPMPQHAARKGDAYELAASRGAIARRTLTKEEVVAQLAEQSLSELEVKEMISIVWEVCGLGDESELGKHFPALAKLGERSSDVLDSLPDSLLKEIR
jgi:hypothetical protein